MGFFSALFGKKKPRERDDVDWSLLEFNSDGVNFSDEEQRSRYIMGCLEQIGEADKEADKLSGEYSLVTSYLSDMEEIEALPEGEKKSLEQKARMIHSLEQDRQQYLGRKNRMTESEFQILKRQEDTVEEGIKKLREAEKYEGLIKQDLRKLDVERQAHYLRKEELEGRCANYRGMAVIFLAALAICLLMLFVLQFGFQMDTALGSFIAVLAGAVAVTIVCVKYLDGKKEAEKIGRNISRLIQLQNTVKIRYVNNTNLLEYLYLKYNTDSAAKLEKLWEGFRQEKEERAQAAEAEAKLERYRDQLVSQLARCRVKDPERWIDQTEAILDKREMVEIRHELILRRQALRKQLEYNAEAAKAAHAEVIGISERFPAYRQEILDMVDKYQQESGRSS